MNAGSRNERSFGYDLSLLNKVSLGHFINYMFIIFPLMSAVSSREPRNYDASFPFFVISVFYSLQFFVIAQKILIHVLIFTAWQYEIC